MDINGYGYKWIYMDSVDFSRDIIKKRIVAKS